MNKINDENEKEILLTLFKSTFKISALTLGGGYVIVPLLRERFADELGWIDEEEMLNFVAIAQSSPGPLAVNTSILIGYKLAGIKGALLATLGTSLPPLLIITVVSIFYEILKDNKVFQIILSSLGAAVAAIIVSAVISMIKNIVDKKDNFLNFIMILSFILVFFFEINVIYLIISSIVFTILQVIIIKKRS